MAEFPPPQAPQQAVPQAPGTQQQQSITPISDTMQQGVQDATGDFITTFIRLAESKGLDLDQFMGDSTTEDAADIAGDFDPAEFLSEEELIMLVQKFEALDPAIQAQLEQQVTEQLGPRVMQRLKAVQRFAHSRGR